MCCQDRHYKLPKDGPSTFPLSSSTCLLISWRTFVFSENRLASLLLESIKHGIWPEELVASVPLKSKSDKRHLKRGILTRAGYTSSFWFKMWKYGSILKLDNLYEFLQRRFYGVTKGIHLVWWNITTNLILNVSFKSCPLIKNKKKQSMSINDARS